MPTFPQIVRASILLYAASFYVALCSAHADEKEVVGWLEKVRLFPVNIVVHAKLDSGADYSSLNASHIEEFEKNGKPWVRFDVSNRFGEKATIEREVSRIAMVKKHFGKPQKRPVVRLGICVGTKYMAADVNLVDRANFENQMLIGRSFLAGNVIIDPAMTFTAQPDCKGDHKA